MLLRSVFWPLLHSRLAMAVLDGVKILGAKGYFLDDEHDRKEARQPVEVRWR